MKEVISSLIEVDGVVGVLITGRDGILIDGEIQSNYDSELIGALIANIAREIEKKIGAKKNVFITLETDKLKLLFSYNSEIILACLASNNSNLGDIRVSIKNGMKRLEEILGA